MTFVLSIYIDKIIFVLKRGSHISYSQTRGNIGVFYFCFDFNRDHLFYKSRIKSNQKRKNQAALLDAVAT